MELRDYLQLARRNWIILVIVPVMVAAASGLNAVRQPKMYGATATVFLRPNDPSERLGTSAGNSSGEIVNADRLVKALANIATGPDVRQAAAAALGATPEAEIEDALTVNAAADSNVLRIRATTREPERSASVANAVANAYIENRRKASVQGLELAIADLDTNLESLRDQLDEIGKQPAGEARDASLDTARTQYQSLSDKRLSLQIDTKLKRGEAELIALARPPKAPVSPKPLRSAVLGLVLGLMGAVVFLLLRHRLDVRLRTRDEVEKVTGLPTLAEVPHDRQAFKDPTHIAAIDSPNGIVAEAIRSLRVSLRFLSLEDPMRVVLVTSAMPSDGKSTLSANLAASYAQAGARTLLVSADLRRPKIETMTSTGNDNAGLVELLSEMADVEEERARRYRARPSTRAVTAAPPSRRRAPDPEDPYVATRDAVDIMPYCHRTAENLWFLPAGRPVTNPVEILGSPVAKDFFAGARESFDMVIVDSPPVVPVSDSLVLSNMVDGVVFVTSLHQTNRHHVSRSMELLASVQAKVVGVVLNRVPRDDGGYYGGYYGYGAKPS